MVTIKSYGYNHIQTHCLLFFLPSSQACNTIMKYATSIKFIKIANHYQMLTDYVHNIQNIPSNIFKTIFDFHNLFNWYLQWPYFYSYFIFKETKVQNFLEGFSLYSLTLTVIKSSKQENEILGNKYPLEQLLTLTNWKFFWRVFFNWCLYCTTYIFRTIYNGIAEYNILIWKL